MLKKETLAHSQLNGKWEHLGAGRHRDAYRHKNFVIKVPLNQEGVFDNEHEADISARFGYSNRAEGINYARCKLLHNSWLVMEYAEPLDPESCPDWAGFVDCSQVGVTRSGRIVAYDYGLT